MLTEQEEGKVRTIIGAFDNGKSVTELNAATTLGDNDVMEVLQGGENKKVPVSVVKESVNSDVLTEVNKRGVFNATVSVPLSAGTYYTLSTAIAAVPTASKSLGLDLKFSTAANTWVVYRYKGSDLSGWSTTTNWEQVPDAAKLSSLETNLNGIAELVKYTGQWYGVEWDTTVSSSALTRIGNMSLHYLLPIQSKMRRCLLLDDGTVNYYLHPTDSTKKEDGSNAILDGTDGQVMVEIPEFYYEFQSNLTKNRVLLSEYPILKNKSNKVYISAYEAALDRTNLKLSSVVNNTAQFRGGNNASANDGTSKTLLGRPVTSLSLNQFRTYARNRGSINWNCNAYLVQKILYWLIAVEYGNFNNQLAYNQALTAEGYRQGGLGNGVTDIDSTKWNAFNGYNPFIPCGHTNLLGNSTGVVAYAMPSEYDAVIKTVSVPTYRGVENPFGHVWKWTDGCKCNIQSNASGGLSEFYVCTNPANFQDADYANYVLRGLLPRTEGYIKSLIVGEFGEMMPLTVGASSTTYMCDYFYTSIPASGVAQRGVLFGGTAYIGATAGVGCSLTNSPATNAYAYIGSRLCYII